QVHPGTNTARCRSGVAPNAPVRERPLAWQPPFQATDGGLLAERRQAASPTAVGHRTTSVSSAGPRSPLLSSAGVSLNDRFDLQPHLAPAGLFRSVADRSQ